MRLSRFAFLFNLIAVVSLAVGAFAVAAVSAAERHIFSPLATLWREDSEPNGLTHAAIREATIDNAGLGISRGQVLSFENRRQARVVGSPALAFDLAVPRQGGLLAA